MRSGLSKLSALLGFGAAVLLAAAPAAARRHSPERTELRGDVPSMHAGVAAVVPATDRASGDAPAHRRAPTASSPAIIGRLAVSPARSSAIARVRQSPDRVAATRLAARGYDATAPPLI